MARTRHFTFFVSLMLGLAMSCGLAACSDEGESLSERVATGSSVRAQKATGTLDITRTEPTGTKPSNVEDDTWTVFVYLCGSDLETENGAATADLAEMVGADGSDQVRFVVETGGAKQWQGDVQSNRLCRFLVQDGAIMDVGAVASDDMGDPQTLSDFLTWGVKNYPSEHMGVILWDHGGGSLSGVCFDERNDDDSLVLRELDQAFASLNDLLWKKFDWDEGEFYDGFDGQWLSLPDGQNLCLYVADSTDDYVLYSCPVNLNGQDCYLRIRQYFDDGSVEVEGSWSGIAASGASDRGVVALKDGDVIIPLYDAMPTAGDGEASVYEGEPYTVGKKGLAIEYGYLPSGTYSYQFCIEDVFGDVFVTDGVTLQIDDDGNTYFVE